MRKIVLNDNDYNLFDIDLASEDVEFYQRHKDAFKRMWMEQGKEFWLRYVMTFRAFTVTYGIIKDFPGKPEEYDEFVDQAFIYIHDEFVDGKCNGAKKFITDVFILGQNRHTIQHLESKSYAKDPFYRKETRDAFRNFFGPANDKSSYLKVYFLLPIYLRLVGSLFECLRRWLDAPELGDEEDESTWWTPPLGQKKSIVEKSQNRPEARSGPPTDADIAEWFEKDMQQTSSEGPTSIPYWNFGDPRIIDDDNPLYDPEAPEKEPDWRHGVDLEKYKSLVLYADRHMNPANETKEDLYRLVEKGHVVFSPPLPGHENRPYDAVQLQAIESFKKVREKHKRGEWAHGVPRVAIINKHKYHKQQAVLLDYETEPEASLSVKGLVLDSLRINGVVNADGNFSEFSVSNEQASVSLVPIFSPAETAELHSNSITISKKNSLQESEKGAATVSSNDSKTSNNPDIVPRVDQKMLVVEKLFASQPSTDKEPIVQVKQVTDSESPKRSRTLDFSPDKRIGSLADRDSSSDDDSSSSNSGEKLLDENAMKQLAKKLHEMNFTVDDIGAPKGHKVQIIKEDEKSDKSKKKNKKDGVNIRFTFNNDRKDGDMEALSETKKNFTQEVATIVKTNMGEQRELPRSVENMVVQEVRKERARERLRKKHEKKKKTGGKASSLLDSVDEGPSYTDGLPSHITQELLDKVQDKESVTELESKFNDLGIQMPANHKNVKDVEKVASVLSEMTKEVDTKLAKNKSKGSIIEKNEPPPAEDKFAYIQQLMREEYKERFADHHISKGPAVKPKKKTLILDSKNSNVKVCIQTANPEAVMSRTKAQTLEDFLSSSNAEKDTKKKKTEARKKSTKPRALKICSNCGAVEKTRRTFKKCQRCETEGAKKSRYYCGRECQVEDWAARHREEHSDELDPKRII